MKLTPRWRVDTSGDVIDAATGKVVWFKTGMPTDGLPDLVANAPEMYELISDVSQAYDDNQSGHELASRLYDLRCVALRLLDKIEGGGDE